MNCIKVLTYLSTYNMELLTVITLKEIPCKYVNSLK
jgi:hypothetical protein